jgi:integrase
MPTLIRRKNGIWYGIFTHRGKRIWRSTLTYSHEEAEVKFVEMCKEFLAKENLNVLQFREYLLPVLTGTLAPSTIRLYDQALRKFCELVGNRKLKDITPYHVEQFKVRRIEKVSAAKTNIDFGVLKAAFNRAVVFQMMGNNPFRSCKRVRVPEQEPRFLSHAEFEALMDVVDDAQMKRIIVLALCTAMRLGEIMSLRWQDVEFGSGVISLKNRNDFTLKTKRRRLIPLNGTAMRLLSSLPRHSEYVFPGKTGLPDSTGWVSKRFKKFARIAGLPKEIHFHSLRHTGATWLVQNGVPLPYVKEILGHQNIATTQIYSHASTDHLRQSVQTLDAAFIDDLGSDAEQVSIESRTGERFEYTEKIILGHIGPHMEASEPADQSHFGRGSTVEKASWKGPLKKASGG